MISNKRILIIDEDRFSRICSALLEVEGFGAEAITQISDLSSKLNNTEFGLIITSYPYGAILFNEIKRRSIPTIILFDHINKNLISTLDGFDNSYCMIKPLDYHKFRSLVRQVMDGCQNTPRHNGECTHA